MTKTFEKKIKRKKVRGVAIAILLVIIGVGIFWQMEIYTKGDVAKNIDEKIVGPGKITATIEIRCDSLSDNMSNLKKKEKAKWIPKDGVILKKTTYVLEKDATVFDLLRKATESQQIQTEYSYTKAYNSYYVEAINHLYEFDGGKLSGWQYYVNKQFPQHGCSKYKLKDNDEVLWVYTCDNGKDIDLNEK